MFGEGVMTFPPLNPPLGMIRKLILGEGLRIRRSTSDSWKTDESDEDIINPIFF